MDVVPYAFCDAVCAVLKDLDALVKLPPDNSNSGIWNAAAAATAAGRVTVDVGIRCQNGVWSYRIYKSAKNEGGQHVPITFQELKAISKHCARTSSVVIGFSYGNSTLDEVKEILQYLIPCINLTYMWIAKHVEIPEDILTEFLVPFCNSSFSEIYAVSYSKATEHFLTVQLQSEGLKIIDIRDQGWSDELRVAIERFALTKPFTNVDVNDSLVFGLKFLKKLLRTSCRHDWFTFRARFGVKFRELRELKKEMQIEMDDDRIVWRRRDGAEIQISHCLDGRLYIRVVKLNLEICLWCCYLFFAVS